MHKRRLLVPRFFGLWIAAAICGVFPILLEPDASAKTSIVAVFDIEVRRVKLDRTVLDVLSDYLASQIASSGKYQIVPRDQLKQRLVAQKKKSYKSCFKQSCQIEIGQELAAEKSLATRIMRIGAKCIVSITLYDLRKATTEAGATAAGECSEAAIMASIDKVVNKIIGGSEPRLRGTPVAKKRARRGRKIKLEWISSKPATISFTKSEITLGQFKACFKAGACKEKYFQTRAHSPNCNWGYPGRDDHPMNCVNWFGARAFCRWAGGRLPTEREWYAEASASRTRAYPWGTQKANCKRAVMNPGRGGCGKNRTWPVCSKPAGNSISGLCDMSGNTWEWVGKKRSVVRIVGGGAWTTNDRDYLRASARRKDRVTDKDFDYGFRCARLL